ncbi:CapA family protein [Hoylesella oralis]|uniref:CapA family protein n=1 Tax=Hoylesella oralis TaxID=28134 RepID=UPI0028E3D421|nr:CapA family protein [Hoylesella oralis]
MAPSDTKTTDEIVKKYDHRKHTVFMRFATMIAACFVCMAKMSAMDTLTVIFTGDILLDRGVRKHIEWGGTGRLFSKGVDSVLRSSDIVVGNLECPATEIVAPVYKRFIFRAEPKWLQLLRQHGFTHLNLANNHSIDQGRRGLTDTWRNIVREGMVPIGAGKNMREASQPVCIAMKPRKIYVLASLRLPLENYAYLPDRPCVSQENIDTLLSRIVGLKKQEPDCYIIVSLHWGIEHTTSPTLQQKIDARRIIDAGADCMICHHTHTLQTIEIYKNHAIYYSIGNFIFDQNKPLNVAACMVKLKISKHSAQLETIPVKSGLCVKLAKE